MSYLNETEIRDYGFKFVGKNVRIARMASIHRPELISIDDNSRIDDFCAISGRVVIGKNVHIAVHSTLVASNEELVIGDFSGLAFGCTLFTSSDDYSGNSLTNPTIPDKYKRITNKKIVLGRHVILGTSTIVFPGVEVAEGCASGALTVLTRSTDPWGIYVGNPARRIKERSRDLLDQEVIYLEDRGDT